MGDDGWKDMPALISRDTIAALCEALKTFSAGQAAPFAVVLHGGEPLMMGARRLKFLFQSLRAAVPVEHVVCMQTNGMLISDEILDICETYRVSLSVSLDGPQQTNDKFRIGKKGESTFDKVTAGIKKLRAHRSSDFLFAGILSVIDPTSDAAEVYEFLKGIGAPSMDFLYRDGNHSNLPFGKDKFESVEYGQWLSGLLDVYLADPLPVRIRFLDDLIKLSLGGRSIKEGLGQSEYGIAVIETDGSISKNDTLKSSFPGADRFGEPWSVQRHSLKSIFDSAEFESYHALQTPTSAQCQACPQLKICGGGMPLHRWKDGMEFNNPSVYCNDQKLIIQQINQKLMAEGVM